MDIPSSLPVSPTPEPNRPKVDGGARAERTATSNKETSRSESPVASATPAESVGLSADDLKQVVEVLNVQAQVVHRNMRFAVDDNTGRTVITLSDSQTGEVIRQIPSEALLRLAERLAGDEAELAAAELRTEGRGRYRRTDIAAGGGALLDTEV